MLQDREAFVLLTELDQPVTIQVAEAGRTLTATHGGLARAELKHHDGTCSTIDLDDAVHVPRLDTNLISIGRLTKMLYEITIAKQSMSLWRKNGIDEKDRKLVVPIPAKIHVFPMTIRPASSMNPIKAHSPTLNSDLNLAGQGDHELDHMASCYLAASHTLSTTATALTAVPKTSHA